MLNRLYIVVGVLAILVLAGGFLIPQFIDWGSYRERIEEIAETNLGADVTIDGDLDFTLLPQPEMRFGRAVVGPLEQPVMEIGGVVAQFSLMDFLRDQFVITSLQVDDPVVYLALDEQGQFDLPIELPEDFTTSNISIAAADITGGSVRFADARTDEEWRLDGFAGQLRISGISGPFALQGNGNFQGEPYALRVNTSALGETDQMQLSMFARPESGGFSLAGEGLLQVGEAPGFSGNMTFRAAPREAADAAEVRGDFLLTGEVELNASRLLVSSFDLSPDENQPSTRLTGAAVLNLGAGRNFDVVLSGGVVALAPRDARQEEEDAPYELVRLLNDLPAVPVPPMPGRIGIDIGELNLRAFSLRNVRLDAATNGQSWQLDTFSGDMPGATELRLGGSISNDEGRLGYDGQLRITSERLDVFSQMWRTPDPDNPLFNLPGELTVNLSLAGGELGLANGVLTLEDESHEFASLLTLEGERGALLSARLGELSPRQSRAILALLPQFVADESFGNTFPNGSIDIAAEQATVLDVEGEGLAATFDWGPDGLTVERLTAQNWGGARLALSGGIGGTVAAPEVSGGGTVVLSFGEDRFATLMLDRLGASEELADWLLRSLPLDVAVDVTPADESGAQVFSMNGRAGVADIALSANLSGGLARALNAPMVLEASLGSDEGEDFADQLGLGVNPLPSDERVLMDVQLGGTASNSFQASLSAVSDEERLGFAGTMIVSDPSEIRGNGQLDFGLSDPGPLLALLGADALSLPPVEGTGTLQFTGNSTFALNNFDARSPGGPGLSGTLGLTTANENSLVTGQVRVDELEAGALFGTLAGAAALIEGDTFWPDGPVDLSPGNRQSRGRIEVTSPWMRAGGRAVLNDVSMVLSWNETGTAIQNLSGGALGGTVEAGIDFCCAGLAADKQVSGRFSAEQVPLNVILPDVLAASLAGTLDGGLRFEGTGASLNEIMESLSGEGSFSVADLEVSGFDPAVFGALAGVEDIADIDAEELTDIVEVALAQGPFTSSGLSGIFNIAAGHARADNLTTEAENARLRGNLDVDLATLGLDGEFSLTPTDLMDDGGLVNPATAEVTALLGGTLLAPERTLDVAQMIDAIQARALELEVERLEALRAAEEARQRALAEERARIMEEEAQRAAEEASRQAAEAEAERLRQEEAARLAEELRRQQEAEEAARLAPLVLDDGGFDLFAVDQGPLF